MQLDEQQDCARFVLRCSRTDGSLARVYQKTQQTPKAELDLALKRQKEVEL